MILCFLPDVFIFLRLHQARERLDKYAEISQHPINTVIFFFFSPEIEEFNNRLKKKPYMLPFVLFKNR